jgi:hypothetical protein
VLGQIAEDFPDLRNQLEQQARGDLPRRGSRREVHFDRGSGEAGGCADGNDAPILSETAVDFIGGLMHIGEHHTTSKWLYDYSISLWSNRS